MATFTFKAIDSAGRESQGTVDADSQNAAVSRLKEKGLFPTSVSENRSARVAAKPAAAKPAAAKSAAAPAAAASAAGIRGASLKPKTKGKLSMDIKLPQIGGTRVKPKQLMVVTRQLATLIDAGLPLLRGLQVIQRQERHPGLKRIMGALGESIQSGSTLAEAMAQHPKVFNKLYVNMVKAGEIGGVLDVVLVRLAEFMEKIQKIRGKVISAMTYPSVVMFVAIGIMFFLMTKIVPKFEQIFADLLGDADKMPGLTRTVMNTSKAIAENSLVVIIGIVAFVVAIRLIGQTKPGRFALDKFKLKAPVFGPLFSKTGIARLTRTLGTLLSSGVPILQALTIVRDTSGNEVIARGIQLVHDSVKEGENIAPPMEASGIFPPMVIGMVEVGEETGKLPDMLMRVANTYDEEVDNTVSALSSIIEPILIVGLALMVGTIVIALFLPMVSIIGSFSQ
ncbi:MAG: type II secretion system F family protein [Kiritimatiellae bacterium]|nr:type II secretion system F family protein [Kiritimatiellia bacterium]